MAQELIQTIASSAYHSFFQGYDTYLDLNFDGAYKSIHILGQIFLSGKTTMKCTHYNTC